MEKLCYYGKNYDTMGKKVLWTQHWYLTKTYGTSIYEEKNLVDYQML